MLDKLGLDEDKSNISEYSFQPFLKIINPNNIEKKFLWMSFKT